MVHVGQLVEPGLETWLVVMSSNPIQDSPVPFPVCLNIHACLYLLCVRINHILCIYMYVFMHMHLQY